MYCNIVVVDGVLFFTYILLHNNFDPMLFPSGNPFECHEEVSYLQVSYLQYFIPPETFFPP